MATEFTYSVADDTATGELNERQLDTEIGAAIPVDRVSVGREDDVLTIIFVTDLTAPQESTLTTTVNNHDPVEIPVGSILYWDGNTWEDANLTPASGHVARWNGSIYESIMATEALRGYIYDAIIPTDYALPSQAFDAGALSVFVKDGTYNEGGNVINIPEGGHLIGEQQNVIIDFTSGNISMNLGGPIEEAGTFSVTHASKDVVGVGTAFTNLSPGHYLFIGSETYEIESIADNTNLTLTKVWQGPSESSIPMFGLQMCSNVIIENVTVCGSTHPSGALALNGVRSLHLKSVNIDNCTSNMIIKNSANFAVSDFVSCSSSGNGIDIANSRSIQFVECNFFANADNGIEITSGLGIKFSACEFDGNGDAGAHIAGSATDIAFEECTAKRNNGIGINTDPGTTRCIINGCTIQHNGSDGVDFDGSENVIVACQIEDNGGHGVQAGNRGLVSACHIHDNASNGINLFADVDTTITSCVIEGNANGIVANATSHRNVISSNQIFENTDTGIEILSGAQNNIVRNNSVHDNTTAQITDAGTDTLLDVTSINNLSDVDTVTTAPSTDDVLKWDGSNWVPGTDVAGSGGGTFPLGTTVGAGVGADYEKLGAAISGASDTTFYIIGDTTEDGNIPLLNGSLTAHFYNGAQVNMNGGQFLFDRDNEIKLLGDGEIRYRYPSPKKLFNTSVYDNTVIIADGVNFKNESSAGSTSLSDCYLDLRNLTYFLPPVSEGGVTLFKQGPRGHNIQNVIFSGGGPNCNKALFGGSDIDGARVSDITLIGKFKPDDATVSLVTKAGVFSNIIAQQNSSALVALGGNVSNVKGSGISTFVGIGEFHISRLEDISFYTNIDCKNGTLEFSDGPGGNFNNSRFLEVDWTTVKKPADRRTPIFNNCVLGGLGKDSTLASAKNNSYIGFNNCRLDFANFVVDDAVSGVLISNCHTGNVGISGSDCIISSSCGSGTLTLGYLSSDNIVVGCKYDNIIDNGTNNVIIDGAGGGSTITIEDEGSSLGSFDTINFVGAGVVATDAGGGEATVTIAGGGGGGDLDGLSDVTITSAASGQVLMYNGADWVNRNKPYINIYEAGTTALSSTPATVDFDTIRLQSNDIAFSLSGGEITVKQAGIYRITYEAATDSNSNTRTLMDMWLEEDTVEVVGTRRYTYNRNTAIQLASNGATCILDLAAGAVLRVRVDMTAGASSGGTTIANGSQITIEFIAPT